MKHIHTGKGPYRRHVYIRRKLYHSWLFIAFNEPVIFLSDSWYACALLATGMVVSYVSKTAWIRIVVMVQLILTYFTCMCDYDIDIWKSNAEISHAHTVVWECCKNDQQSQWKMLKFDPQLHLNPLSYRHQIRHAWLRHGCLSARKKLAQSVKRFLLSIYAKYTPPCSLRYPIRMFITFLVLPIAYSRDACMDFNA